MTVGIFVFCGWWFSNQLDIVSKTHFSCDTVDRGLWVAILSSLLCPETDRNSRIGKQGYVLYFTDFKKWCFDVSFLTSIRVLTVVLTLGKVENKLISETFCLLGLLNSRWSNGSWLTKSKFVRGLVSLDCWLRLLENYFSLYHFLKETALSFIFWLLEPVQCLGNTFLYLIFRPVT